MNKKAFCLWSGGKDSHLACMEARASGVDIQLLLTFFNDIGKRSMSHNLPLRLVREQGQLVGVHLQEVFVSREQYGARLKDILRSLAPQGINTGVFGDIYLEEHRTWIEKLCEECNVTPLFPLWGKPVEEIFDAQQNFESVIVSVDTAKLEEQWLGKKVDQQFKRHLMSKGLDLCGERGEYHTFVTKSPAMHGMIQLRAWKKSSYDSYRGIDVQDWAVISFAGRELRGIPSEIAA